MKDLNLSDKQVSKLKKADEDFDAEVKALREKRQEAQKSFKESMKAAKERRDSTMKSILTKDQYIQYLEQKLERLEKRPMQHNMQRRDMQPMNKRFSGKRHMKPGCPLNPAPEAPAPDAPAINPPAPEALAK